MREGRAAVEVTLEHLGVDSAEHRAKISRAFVHGACVNRTAGHASSEEEAEASGERSHGDDDDAVEVLQGVEVVE